MDVLQKNKNDLAAYFLFVQSKYGTKTDCSIII